MKRLILVFVVFGSVAKGQSVYTNVLAGASALHAEKRKFWGELAYPACINSAGLAIGVFGEQRFMTDLAFYEIGFRFGIGKQPFLFRMSGEGNSGYSNLVGALATVKKIDERIAFSVGAGYQMHQARGYKSRGSPVAGVGVLIQLSESCTWAAQADGVNSFFSGSGQGYFRIRTGMGYKLSELAAVTIEMIKETDLPVQAIAGISYAVTDHSRIDLGYSSQLSSFILGFTYCLAGLEVRVSSGYHNALGATAGLAMVYQPKYSAE